MLFDLLYAYSLWVQFSAEEALVNAKFLQDQTNALATVYHALQDAWWSFCFSEEGSIDEKDLCIYTRVPFRLFFDKEKEFQATFWIDKNEDKLQHAVPDVDGRYHKLGEFLNPILVEVFELIYFDYNYRQEVDRSSFKEVFEECLKRRLEWMLPAFCVCTQCGSTSVEEKSIEHLTPDELECLQIARTELYNYCGDCDLLPDQYDDDDPIREDSLLQRILNDDGCPEEDDGWDER